MEPDREPNLPADGNEIPSLDGCVAGINALPPRSSVEPPEVERRHLSGEGKADCRRLCSRGEGGREGVYTAATASFQPQLPLREEMDNFFFTQRVTEFRGGRSTAPSPVLRICSQPGTHKIRCSSTAAITETAEHRPRQPIRRAKGRALNWDAFLKDKLTTSPATDAPVR